ncbi:hypothetical protein CLV30_12012 [Haloactinopolyspora alba]|uniref:YCII-related domain-containing protein n=1 Tax=Haloactinopolyspora alba TaxID=648780 RepID=A0A2P8DLX3_9ACTN|nr:YciI family protein [Haloactinopolyspora alba]PSK98226.1 hypothetical protein CLV30_12012 [Haloactinopolyspora alba]
MKYMLMLFENDTDWDAVPDDQRDAALDEHRTFVEFLEESGAAHSGEALRPANTATTLRPDGDDVLVTDGPYLELKENLAGFYIIEAPDLDRAIDIARRCPIGTATEIRPIWDVSS